MQEKIRPLDEKELHDKTKWYFLDCVNIIDQLNKCGLKIVSTKDIDFVNMDYNRSEDDLK